MAVNWTEAQLRAITSRGGALLVSAAAGSGKTAVLVERVIRRILDTGDPCNIDEFLIVTFTKAAAAEMKAKIADALTERLLETPSDRHLRRQLTLLDHAQITTVHSFCAYLLRENFQAAGLTPDFRVADEDEIAILRENILDELIESRYENRSTENEGFFMLVESLSAMRDDSRLRSVILETFAKLQSHPYPQKWISEMLTRSTEEKPLESVYGQILIDAILDRCYYAKKTLSAARETMRLYPSIEKAYGAAYTDDLSRLETLIRLLEERRWDEAAAFANGISFTRLSAVRGFDDPVLLDLIKAPRDAWKKMLGTFCRDYFGFTELQFLNDMRAVEPYSHALFSLVSEYMDRMDDEKRLRNILDFSDLEHLTVRMLLGDDGKEPTPLAGSLSCRYTEIMVDEYQDTNEVQDAIFHALSREGKNLFLVGDMKQSIYSFRLANPDVFLRKYMAYADNPAPGEPGRVILAKNFRSRQEVTEAVNYIFENVMSPNLGDISYGKEERLIPGAEYPASQDSCAELCLVETAEEDDLSGAEADAAYVAARIRDMLEQEYPVYDRTLGDMRPCLPEDFAILLRSVKSKAVLYETALLREGIAARKDVGSELFDSPDVIILMSLIDVLDNPEQDIPLASLMRSPLYSFTADELAQIRIAAPGASFYRAVCHTAQEENALGTRCAAMLKTLQALRLAAEDMPADRLVMRILNETRLEAVCSHLTDGPGKLHAFLEQAQRFERAGYCGLYRFAHMMRALRERGCEVAPSSSSVSAVHIMSVHKSKGLEFPIVFLSNCSQRFNTSDLTDPVLIHPRLGPGFRRRQVDRRIEYPTLPRLAIAVKTRQETLSEEMRILYVAMTRAREKLIVTAPVKSASALAAKYYPDLSHAPLPHQMLLACISPLSWILAPVLRLPCSAPIFSEAGIAVNFDEAENHSWSISAAAPSAVSQRVPQGKKEEAAEPAFSREQLYEKLAFRYPYGNLSDVPSKLTATALKGRFTDEEAAENAVSRVLPDTISPYETSDGTSPSSSDGSNSPNTVPNVYRRPRFIQDAGLTGSERGTALHLVMQFIDFRACTSREGIEAEIRRLYEKRFLTPEQAASVDAGRILAFFSSPLGIRMMSSGRINREFKFSLLASCAMTDDLTVLAYSPNTDDDTLLFQGVIDCYFEEPAGIILIDFKTDFVLPGSERILAERYRQQLTSYALALTRITGKSVAERHLYFFRTGADLCI